MNSKKFKISLCILVFVSFYNASCLAQISKQDWFGSYVMNHDGWIGTLTISATQADCSESPWCDMSLTYANAEGTERTGTIVSISADWQEINFEISFPDNNEPFTGYMFSQEKGTIAGTTIWDSNSYGFFATKSGRPSGNPGTTSIEAAGTEADQIVMRQILDDGGVEHTFADGTRKIYYDGSIQIISPDGRTSQMSMVQVMPVIPPALMDDSAANWFATLNENMDELVGHLLKGDAASIRNYSNSLAGLKAAERINFGMKKIGFLVR